MLYGVAAATTYADDLDDRFLRVLVDDFKHVMLLFSCRIEGLALRSGFSVALAAEKRRASPALFG